MCRIKPRVWMGWVKTTKDQDFHPCRIPAVGQLTAVCRCPKPSLGKALSFVTTKAIWFSEDSCSGISEKNIYKLDFPRLRYGETSKPLGKWQLKHLNVQNIFEYHWTVDVLAEYESQIRSVCQKWVRKVLQLLFMPKAPSADSFRDLKSINILADNKLHFLN